MKLTYKVFSNRFFPQALEKIIMCNDLSSNPILGLKIFKAHKKIIDAYEPFDKIKTNLYKKFRSLVPKKEGDTKPEEFELVGKNLELFEEAFSKLQNEEFELDIHPIKYDPILKFHPADMSGLGWLFDFNDFEDKPKKKK